MIAAIGLVVTNVGSREREARRSEVVAQSDKRDLAAFRGIPRKVDTFLRAVTRTDGPFACACAPRALRLAGCARAVIAKR